MISITKDTGLMPSVFYQTEELNISAQNQEFEIKTNRYYRYVAGIVLYGYSINHDTNHIEILQNGNILFDRVPVEAIGASNIYLEKDDLFFPIKAYAAGRTLRARLFSHSGNIGSSVKLVLLLTNEEPKHENKRFYTHPFDVLASANKTENIYFGSDIKKVKGLAMLGNMVDDDELSISDESIQHLSRISPRFLQINNGYLSHSGRFFKVEIYSNKITINFQNSRAVALYTHIIFEVEK